jgi:phenylacetate-CoA ligase
VSFRRFMFDQKVRAIGGKPYAEFLRSARAADDASPAELLDRQRRDAAELVRYAMRSTPWYAQRLAHLDGGDFTDGAVFEKIPVLEKENLRDHYEDLVARDSGVKRSSVARTGGSTGQPLRVLKDFTIRPATLTWRLMQWWGVDPADNSASIERLPWKGLRHQANEAFWWPTRKANVDAGSMRVEDLQHFAERLQRVKPRMLWGYASSLHEFARAVEQHGWDVPAPVAISSTAAPLTAHQSADIERILGAPVYETYRAAELSLIAGQCEKRRGMHIQADHKLLEIVDEDGRRVPDGEPGEIVVTDLLNRAQPILRYRLGDVGVIDTEPCACGRPFPVLKSLLGRSNDVLRTPTGLVSIYSFASAFSKDPAISQYQIHQMADYSLVLKVVPSSDDVTLVDLNSALRVLAGEFKGELQVSAELVPRIEHVRGKQKSIVSHLPD